MNQGKGGGAFGIPTTKKKKKKILIVIPFSCLRSEEGEGIQSSLLGNRLWCHFCGDRKKGVAIW